MSWRPHGRATVNRSNLQAWGCCDRCNFWYLRSELQWQFEWDALQLYNKRLLVCKRTCLDKPFEHNRAIVVPPDPVPVMNPRPDLYQLAQDAPTVLMDAQQEILTDTSGAPILATSSGTLNIPPYPFAGFTMLRADGGGPIIQMAVRDEAYAIQVRNDVQQQLNPGQKPQFSASPAPNPNFAYNGQNVLNSPPGQIGAQYDFPVVLDIFDD
jgi:hypothetical protein